MSLESFLEAAWKDHADRPEDVADRLPRALAMLQSAADVAPLAAIVTHVYGEHLARWDAGILLLQALRAASPEVANPAASRAIDRSIAILKYAANAELALTQLPTDDQ